MFWPHVPARALRVPVFLKNKIEALRAPSSTLCSFADPSGDINDIEKTPPKTQFWKKSAKVRYNSLAEQSMVFTVQINVTKTSRTTFFVPLVCRRMQSGIDHCLDFGTSYSSLLYRKIRKEHIFLHNIFLKYNKFH